MLDVVVMIGGFWLVLLVAVSSAVVTAALESVLVVMGATVELS